MKKLSEHADVRASIEAWLARPTKPTGTTEISELDAAIGTTVGEVRSENQDRAIIAQFTDQRELESSFRVCVLCDGMGGMVDGGRCADIAISTFLYSLCTSTASLTVETTRKAVLEANSAIFQRYKGRGGTTLTALMFTTRAALWAVTVGDTRLHQFSRSQGIQQLSTDDTIAGEVRRLKGTQSESELEPFSNRLAQFVGIGDGLEPRTQIIDVDAGDSNFLLTTDGTRVIDEATFERVASATPSRIALVTRLLHLSNWCGGGDNSSVICVAGRAPKSIRHTSPIGYPILEVWDSFAKLDVVLLVPPRSPEDRQVPPAEPSAQRGYGQVTAKPNMAETESRGRPSRSRRQKKAEPKRPTAEGPPPPRPAQKQLEIEIVENTNANKAGPKTDQSLDAGAASGPPPEDAVRPPENRDDKK